LGINVAILVTLAVQETPDQSKVGSRELFEYFKIVIGGVVGGTVLRLLSIIPDVITVLPVTGFLMRQIHKSR
jgi:hypothetical protein